MDGERTNNRSRYNDNQFKFKVGNGRECYISTSSTRVLLQISWHGTKRRLPDGEGCFFASGNSGALVFGGILFSPETCERVSAIIRLFIPPELRTQIMLDDHHVTFAFIVSRKKTRGARPLLVRTLPSWPQQHFYLRIIFSAACRKCNGAPLPRAILSMCRRWVNPHKLPRLKLVSDVFSPMSAHFTDIHIYSSYSTEFQYISGYIYNIIGFTSW